MDNKKAPSPFAVLWGWASGKHGGFYASVALAVLGGGLRYGAILLRGCYDWAVAERRRPCGVPALVRSGPGRLCGKGAVFHMVYQPVPHGHLSHAAACAAKSALQTEPGAMGTILDTPSGQYKTTIVDRVEGMEPTLAHLLPEMTSNLLVPVSIAVYIFVLDWRWGSPPW